MKLYNYLIAVAAAALAINCSSKEKQALISGTFTENSPENVRIYCPELEIDTLVPVTDGKFSYALPFDKTIVADLSFQLDDNTWNDIVIPDCESIVCTVNGADVDLSFSDAKSLNNKIKDIVKEQEQLHQILNSNPDAIEEYIKFGEKLLEENPDNFIGYYGFLIASQFSNTGEEWLALANKLADNIKEKPEMKAQIEALEKEFATAEGSKFIDFEVTQPDGTVKKFSDYVGRGKYILVDFWASWCGPCMREVPNLKAAYEKYHGDNFDILSVAVFDKPEDSQVAIDAHGLEWNQIINAQDIPSNIYGFNSIPQIFLFGPDGTLLKRSGLRGEGIENTLKEYLN